VLAETDAWRAFLFQGISSSKMCLCVGQEVGQGATRRHHCDLIIGVAFVRQEVIDRNIIGNLNERFAAAPKD